MHTRRTVNQSRGYIMLEYTKEQLKEVHRQAVMDLVNFAGGRTHLAKMLNKPLPTINSWVDRGVISKQGVKAVCDNSALKDEFPVSRLRPEL